MSLFLIEIIIACYVKPDYIFSFFFWLDVLATISMLFDIGWLMDAIDNLFASGGSANKAAKVASTSRAA